MSKPKVLVGKGIGSGLTNVKVIGAARKEKNFQIKLDAMLIALANNDIALTKSVSAADAELKRIKKIQREIQTKHLNPVSNYATLKQLYDERLSKITKENLHEDKKEDAKAFINRAFDAAKVTEDQKTIVSRYYAAQAEKEWGVITQVKAVLDVFYKKGAEQPAEELQPAVVGGGEAE